MLFHVKGLSHEKSAAFVKMCYGWFFLLFNVLLLFQKNNILLAVNERIGWLNSVDSMKLISFLNFGQQDLRARAKFMILMRPVVESNIFIVGLSELD
jgi:hypothetical protein